MNSDPAYQRFREIAWRRPLTEQEQVEWQAWLTAHPDALAEAELDTALDRVLSQCAPAPVPSNFTVRVMKSIELADPHSRRAKRQENWWRMLVPRFAILVLVACVGLFGYYHYVNQRQAELAVAARQLAKAHALSDPVVIEDFDVIRGLSPTVTVDEGLLALSDDLLALDQ